MKNPGHYKKFLHYGFEAGLLVKGFDGLLEIIGGMAMIFISPDTAGNFVRLLTVHEISEDPADVLANLLVSLSRDYSASLQAFMVIYLLTHGLVKIIMVYLLQKRQLWAYPASIGFLVIFTVYQLYRFAYGHSALMMLLSLLDAVIIWLVLEEYKQIRNNAAPAAGAADEPRL